MDIIKLRVNPKRISKLKKLSICKLNHLIQLIDIHLESYKENTANYSKQRYEKYYIPYIQVWTIFKQEILDIMDDILFKQ